MGRPRQSKFVDPSQDCNAIGAVARGLDTVLVDLVMKYNMPNKVDTYVPKR